MARLVYLGTPDAAVPPLRTLVEAGHEVVLVVSRPDKRRGRGGVTTPSPVKAAAMELGLPVTDSLDDLAGVEAELGVVVAYGRIIPVAVLDRLPMVNLHFSLLPRWRGAAPVERALLEGDAETGVCLMAVEAGLDTGPVYAVRSLVIGEEETAAELRSRLVEMGCALLSEHLAGGRAGLPIPRDQVGTPTYAEKILPGELQLDWDRTASEIGRVVRVGRAWTHFRGRRLGIVAATVAGPTDGEETGAPDGPEPPGPDGPVPPGPDGPVPPGTLVGTEVVAGDGGRVRLVTVQPEGKRPMDAAAWRNGVRPDPGERLGA
jgi:methionyl-tRNA formyltransferase